jgi:hypothetical protein
MIGAAGAIRATVRAVALSAVRTVAAALCVDEQAAYGRSTPRTALLHVVASDTQSTTDRTP